MSYYATQAESRRIQHNLGIRPRAADYHVELTPFQIRVGATHPKRTHPHAGDMILGLGRM